MGLVEHFSGTSMIGYFKGDSKRTHVQLFRYGFVAAAAFAVDFGVLALLASDFHVNYLLAAAVSFILGLVTNYVLSTVWVFSAYSARNRKYEFGIFALTGIVGLALTEVLIWFFTSPLHLYYLLSKLIAAFIVVIWNFSARKMLLYR